MTDAATLSRIEDFRTDLDAAAVAAGEAANTRSIAMQVRCPTLSWLRHTPPSRRESLEVTR